MHETSIVESLLEAIERELRARPEARLRMVWLRIGRLRQVEPATLSFCFQAAVAGTPFEGSRLEIERVAAAARCLACGLEFAVEENWFECPRCHSTHGRLSAGNELQLIRIEIEPISAVANEGRAVPAATGDPLH